MQIINRGTAEHLEESESGIFIHDTLGNSYMLRNENAEEGIEWLKKHEHKGYKLMTLYDDQIIEFVKNRYNVSEEMRCYQGVWTKPDAPPLKGLLNFRRATKEDVPFLSEHYHDWTDEYGLKVIGTGELFIASLPGPAGGLKDADSVTDDKLLDEGDENAGEVVGFIGRHLEGATGLLFVLPEFRNRGFAEEMENFMCARALAQGVISFGHVIVGNEISMNLQKKMGVEFWDGKLSWIFI